jgi:cyclophilin family peptidyl-prolyl cis-trans isomerase/HEAT repeat protein
MQRFIKTCGLVSYNFYCRVLLFQRVLILSVVFQIFPFQMTYGASDISTGTVFRGCSGRVAWAILDAENNRRAGAPIFSEVLATEPSDHARGLPCMSLALTALGRIGSARSVGTLVSYLDDSNVKIRMSAAFGLGLIGDASVLARLKDRLLVEQDANVSVALSKSVGRLGGVVELEFFDTILGRADTGKYSGALQGLGFLFLKDSAAWPMPADLMDHIFNQALSPTAIAARHAGFAAARYRGVLTGSQQANLLLTLAAVTDDEAKAFLLRAAGKIKTQAAVTAICEAYSPVAAAIGVRIEALKALAQGPVQSCTHEILRLGLVDKSAAVRHSAVSLAGALVGTTVGGLASVRRDGEPELVQNIFLRDASYWVRENAAKVVAVQDVEFAQAQMKTLIRSPRVKRRHLGLLMMTTMVVTTEDLQTALSGFAADLSVSLVQDLVALVASKTDQELSLLPRGFESLKLDLQAQFLRGDVGVTSAVAELVGEKKWSDFETSLRSAFSQVTGPDALEGKVAILNALAKVGGESSRRFLFETLSDPKRLVAMAAAEAIQALYHENVSDRVPPAGDLAALTPSINELNSILSQHYTVVTNRGNFSIRLNSLAPISAFNFAKLAGQGFYRHILIHRVVPNFVVQAGDPRGDGYGGPGYEIRDEASMASHLRGTVGMATAGKDTGGSQFFVNHGGNYHLDGVYTNFGTVTSGMAIVDKLEQGDMIIKVTVN